jgi:hypothetical protein
VPSCHQKRYRKPDINHTQPVPTTVNCYELLNNLKEPTNITLYQRVENKQKTEGREKMIMARRKHEVLIIGDSHTKGCVAEVSPNFGEDFEVSGLVMPGWGLEFIINMVKKETAILTRDNVLVVWEGTNKISKNESFKGFTSPTT